MAGWAGTASAHSSHSKEGQRHGRAEGCTEAPIIEQWSLLLLAQTNRPTCEPVPAGAIRAMWRTAMRQLRAVGERSGAACTSRGWACAGQGRARPCSAGGGAAWVLLLLLLVMVERLLCVGRGVGRAGGGGGRGR